MSWGSKYSVVFSTTFKPLRRTSGVNSVQECPKHPIRTPSSNAHAEMMKKISSIHLSVLLNEGGCHMYTTPESEMNNLPMRRPPGHHPTQNPFWSVCARSTVTPRFLRRERGRIQRHQEVPQPSWSWTAIVADAKIKSVIWYYQYRRSETGVVR